MTLLHRAPLALAVAAVLLFPSAPAFAAPDARPPGVSVGRIPAAAPDIRPPFMRVPGSRIPLAVVPDARAPYERLSRSPLRLATPVRATIPKTGQAEVKRNLP